MKLPLLVLVLVLKWIDDVLIIIVVHLMSTKSMKKIGKMVDMLECSIIANILIATSVLLIIIDVETVLEC